LVVVAPTVELTLASATRTSLMKEESTPDA
jgi:hypothetical protein